MAEVEETEEQQSPGEKNASKPSAKPKKKKKGLVIFLVVFVLLLGGGGGAVYFLAAVKKPPLLNIPGLTPEPEPVAVEEEETEEVVVAETSVEPEVDELKGATELAGLWEQFEPDSLADILQQEPWSDAELALILRNMKPEKAAETMQALPSEKAAAISKELKLLASQTEE
jgi:hypothetical protein